MRFSSVALLGVFVLACAPEAARAPAIAPNTEPSAHARPIASAANERTDVEITPVPADERPGPRVELTWFVHPPGAEDPSSGLARRRVELEVRSGSSIQRAVLGDEMGALDPRNQTLCKTRVYPNEGDDVAKLVFYYGGAGGFTLRRARQDTLIAVAWSQPDGGCMNAQGQLDLCPGSERRITTFTIPSDDPIEEAIVELDQRGSERRLVCDAE